MTAAFASTLGIVPHVVAAITGLAVQDGPREVPVRTVLSSGVTLNLLDPKLTIFFVALLPQLVPAGSNGATWLRIGLSLVFMVMTFVVFTADGVAAGLLRLQVLARPRVVDRVRKAFAAPFAALGVRLALEPR